MFCNDISKHDFINFIKLSSSSICHVLDFPLNIWKKKQIRKDTSALFCEIVCVRDREHIFH